MPIFEAPAVRVQSSLITLATYFIQHAYLKPIIDFRSSDANFVPLDKPTIALYIRRDNGKRQTLVNVFDQNGDKVYTIERESSTSPVWSLLTFPQRKEVATIRAGFFLTAVDFHNKKIGLQHRQVNSESGLTVGRMRTFYLDDGHKYGWTRGTKFLEKIVNPGGAEEEIRERVAKVRLMRQWKFDYEMIIDEDKVDVESALATGFICMMSFWGVGDITETRKKEATDAEAPVTGVPNITLVMDADDDADFIVEKG
ncbi:DEKNAAC104190 [Brettanomyces naardenensis]|uniref:DEKNAAC104191 n=1 Tax=Brettanomyces naardenensis TaxID=13370 RepID=A0A448YQ87_BRENA|nr:DEKNAAC104190 [Brettanomyces naardenensis]